MRILNLVLITACLASGCAFANAAENSVAFAKNPVVSHRGAWKKNALPENSIASLKRAIEIKCTGSEFDVQMTADNMLIINHDPTYNKLPVEKTKYADLAAVKLSNGEKLPTLSEYLLAGKVNNSSTRLICEIKPSEISKERGKTIAAKVLRLVTALKVQEMVVFISFDYDILKKLIELNPSVSTQYLGGDKTPEQLRADGISGADYHFSVFKTHPEWIESAKKNRIILNAWTVDESAEMDWLLANNFDFITTNEPELLFERMKLSPVFNGMKLVWSDEFNYTGLPDSTKWNYDVGGDGWGNSELEYYTLKDTLNAVVGKGYLTITARKQTRDKNSYTSARLLTKNKADFKYGRIEARAQIPAAVGTWPAIWMLGANIDKAGWPACGEIDIMEHRGSELNKIFGTLHYPGRSGGNADGKTINISTATTAFHIYAAEWDESAVKIYVDDQLVHTVINNNTLPFNQNFFILLNVAMGGSFAGKVDPLFSKDAMKIDYVRVFQK